MPASNLHNLSRSDDPKQVLAHCPASVAGLPITVLPIPGHGDVAADVHLTPRIFVAHQGRGRRWYTSSGRTREMHTASRMVEIYQGGLAFERVRWEGETGRCVLVEFPDAAVQAITRGKLETLRLNTEHEVFDDRLSRLALDLAQEAIFGQPRGDLYVQGLCMALLGALSSRQCSGIQLKEPPARHLGAVRQRRLAELVAAEYGSKLSLSRLAAEVDLSPQHLARLFKATFGATPHEYVQQVRLDAAVKALRSGEFPNIAAVAQACGFASHSHMSDLLRRQRGVRPRELRQGRAEREPAR